MPEALNLIKDMNWPVAGLIFGIVFICLFRRQIADLVTRISRIGKAGIETEGIQTVPLSQESQQKRRATALEELTESERSVTVKDTEESIKQDLKKQGLETESEASGVLIRQLTMARVGLFFEWAYGQIFGSQISLLKKLNEVSGEGLTPQFVETFFASVKQKYPDPYKDWEIDRYLSFLRDQLLITTKDNNHHITIRGSEFLVWLVKNQRSEDKPY
jgi:hypothetical protein